MQTVDDEFFEAATVFIKDQVEAEKPFFVWFNATHMHFRTHVKPESKGQAGRWQSEYHDTMIDHDALVGDLLGLLDELDIAEDTIVIYSTDNGPHMNSWPDAGTTPFRGEKNTNWEGAYRVPEMIRWPGKIPAGSVLNGIVSAQRLVSHPGRGSWQRQHSRAVARRNGAQRDDVQGASRRAQLVAVSHR